MDESLARLRHHLPNFFILLFIYLTLTWSIQSARWAEGLHLLTWVVVGGLAIGFLLAESRWPACAAHGYALFVGIIIIALLMGTLLPPALSWKDRLLALGGRIYQWISIMVGGGINYDNLAFILQLALLLWLFSYFSAWQFFRHGRLGAALIPPAAGLLINLYFAPPKLSPQFMVYLGLAFLLAVRHRISQRQGEWETARVVLSEDARFDLLRDGLLIALLALFLAWVLPSTANVHALSRLGDRLQAPIDTVKEEWDRMFASLTRYESHSEEIVFGGTKLLGGPVNLSDAPIVDIAAEDGRYWGAAAYDFYGGRGWAITYEERGPLGEEASPLAPPPYAMRKLMEQSVWVRAPAMRAIIAAPLLYDVDLPAEARLLYLPREGATAARPPADIALALPQYRLYEGDAYRALSYVSTADEASLRSAGTDYPAWVRERYLQLPDSLPARVRRLAEYITREAPTNYDKALAIEHYLRAMPYNESIEAPPSTVDAVDYFLFEKREGYCDYFASAMVVLARSAGIPARFVQGYAQGEAAGDPPVFHVIERNGHAWPELFFPGYGWILFEPTPVEPVPIRPADAASLERADAGESPAPADHLLEEEEKFGPTPELSGTSEGTLAAEKWENAARLGKSAGLALAILLGLLGLSRAVWRIILPRRLSPAQRAYVYLTRAGRWLAGVRPLPGWTPYEFAGHLGRALPSASADIQGIVSLYVREQYGAPLDMMEDSQRAMELWREARPRLFSAGLNRVVRRWGQKMRALLGRAG